jgi:hypothetical protein
MKKIYTLLLLFTITLFYSIPTQAYTLDGNDIPIAALGGLTLNEVFVDNNDLNGKFYSAVNSNIDSVVDGIFTLSINNLNTANRLETTINFAIPSNVYYINSNIFPLYSNASFHQIGATTGLSIAPIPNQWNFQSSILTAANNTRVRFYHHSTPNYIAGDIWKLKDLHVINLTALSLTALSKTSLDYWYYEFQFNNIYIKGFADGELSSTAYANGFNAGYEVGYGDGYQDAVEEDNAYALGYAKGLLEGGDMETGSSLLILIVALIGFVMMIFGFTTKRGIFNLLSVGAFVVLGTLLVQFVGFVIIAIGLVIINIYYAFFGDV